MGGADRAYAAAHRLQYRLMFGTPLPDPSDPPAMMREARHAFSLLRDGLARVAVERGAPASEDALDRDALSVWASMHGLASIPASPAVGTLGLSPTTLAAAGSHGLARVALALSAPVPTQDAAVAHAASIDPDSTTSRSPTHGDARPTCEEPSASRRHPPAPQASAMNGRSPPAPKPMSRIRPN